LVPERGRSPHGDFDPCAARKKKGCAAISREKEVIAMRCRLCNEHIEDVDMDYGDIVEISGEYWHPECFAEYFGETVDVA
jgi:hypothetical protein